MATAGSGCGGLLTSRVVPIDGSDGAHRPFWSPDGRSIAFFAHNRLKRIAEAGGLPQDICEVGWGEGSGTWSREGVILFSAFGQALSRVAETGGLPTPATALDPSRQQVQALVARVPAGWAALPVSGAEQRSGRDGGVSGDPWIDRNTAGVRRGVPCRGRGSARSDAQQGAVDRPALQRGTGAGRRRGYDDRGARGLGHHPALGRRPVGGRGRRGRIQERERGQSPDLVDWTGKRDRAFPARADYHHPWLSPTRSGLAWKRPPGDRKARGLDARSCARHNVPFASRSDRRHRPIWSPDGTVSGLDRTVWVATTCTEIASDGSGGESWCSVRRRAAWKSPTGRSTDDFSCTKSSAGERTTACLAALAC